jgi:adenylate kinase
MAFHVVYLTGAPASGKTTLCKRLQAEVRPLEVYHYSALLVDHIRSSRADLTDLSEDDLRERSATLITPEDVAAVDRRLIEMVHQRRLDSHVIIDSHAVTKESYGYRVTPFAISMLQALQPTLIAMLYAEAHEIDRRIARSSGGRPAVSKFEADLHIALQAQVAVSYGLQLGLPVYVFDSTGSVEQASVNLASKLNGAVARGPA